MFPHGRILTRRNIIFFLGVFMPRLDTPSGSTADEHKLPPVPPGTRRRSGAIRDEHRRRVAQGTAIAMGVMGVLVASLVLFVKSCSYD